MTTSQANSTLENKEYGSRHHLPRARESMLASFRDGECSVTDVIDFRVWMLTSALPLAEPDLYGVATRLVLPELSGF